MHEIDCLPPVELTTMTQRMVDAMDPATAQRLQADLGKGFLGYE